MMDFDRLLADNHSRSINQINHSSDYIIRCKSHDDRSLQILIDQKIFWCFDRESKNRSEKSLSNILRGFFYLGSSLI